MDGCIDPDRITEDMLADYALNAQQADPDLVDHLLHCEACRESVARQRALVSTITTRLARFDCPSIISLDAYVAGELPLAEHAAIADHVTTCLRCQREVAMIQHVIAVPPDRTLVSFLAPSEEVGDVLALRGGDEAGETARRSFTFTVDTYVLELFAVPENEQMLLYGEFSHANLEAIPVPIAVRLFLLSPSEPGASSMPVTEALVQQGEFKLGPLAHGTYQIEIVVPERIFVVAQPLLL